MNQVAKWRSLLVKLTCKYICIETLRWLWCDCGRGLQLCGKYKNNINFGHTVFQGVHVQVVWVDHAYVHTNDACM